jgi:tellurite resistance-related uncharacterized protein
MNFQNIKLPENAVKVGSTPVMDEKTVLKGILEKHLSPKGKIGFLVVDEGALQYVWEDDADNVLDADVNHPIVIESERYHHVVITGPVKFHVEFFKVENSITPVDKIGERPGEGFLFKK